MKRVLIIESGLFIGGVIHDLLKNYLCKLQVRSLIPANVTDIRREINEFNPDLVIVDDSSPEDVLNAIMQCAMQFPRLKLVEICADTNHIQIFNMHRVEMVHLEDFLAVLSD